MGLSYEQLEIPLTFKDPSTWNSLPDSLRHPELSLNTFKRQLKT